jgi:hypothetical protein
VLPSKCYERLPDRVSRSTGNLRRKRHSVRHAGPDTRPLTRGHYRCDRAHGADHYRHIHGDRLPAQPAQLRPIQNPSCDSRTTVIVSGGVDPLTPPQHAHDLAAAIPNAVHLHVPTQATCCLSKLPTSSTTPSNMQPGSRRNRRTPGHLASAVRPYGQTRLVLLPVSRLSAPNFPASGERISTRQGDWI